ncbi:hypothetical protein [Kutzneria sp. CA-103260]|uniref:hypothetical protein n=1 Tax=Kutzneria sp. CA-103260 TaxID=2802641 RepID=UPI001BACC567|nr:hypothetical protein [Kutzneria sp. CA-103260]QUQ62972.1 hypothetical protein JJ691_06840 [Kutzneria sp. CA-103260]
MYSLRREHVVAASLVGSVVVVLGFASGLGLHHTSTTVAAPPVTTGTPPPPATEAGGGVDQTGDGQQSAGSSGPVDNPYVATTTSTPAPTVTGTAAPTTPTTTTPGATTSTTGPTCTPGLAPLVVDSLTTGVQGLPLLGPVVSGIGLPPLVDTLLGSCPTVTTTTTAR